jgi:hypothetical protein
MLILVLGCRSVILPAPKRYGFIKLEHKTGQNAPTFRVELVRHETRVVWIELVVLIFDGRSSKKVIGGVGGHAMFQGPHCT